MCKKSYVGKIYKTTDGYFTGSNHIKKPRRVAVIHQRKDDNAVAVVKIRSKKDKVSNYYIPKLILKPKNHPSLTKDSIVENNIIVGKKEDGKFKSIYTTEFVELNDKLTRSELRKIKKATKKSNKNKIKKWKRHFK